MNELIEKIFANQNVKNNLITTWQDFINIALYDEELGYYKRDKIRVGGENSDFYTASSLKQKVFSALVKSSAESILNRNKKNIGDYKFLEIGAEPERQIIEDSLVIRLGDEIVIPQNSIVISNELLDARPFERFRFESGKWKKRLLKISRLADNYSFSEELIDASDSENYHLIKYFPHAKVEGFSIDVSFDALELFEKICTQNWQGVLIFADYFRTARELSELPLGTARSYFKHTVSADVTQNAGLADITFSPCSDTLMEIVKKANFKNIRTDFQSNFFIEFASAEIRKIIETDEKDYLKKRELSELISPVHLGNAFRILSACRL